MSSTSVEELSASLVREFLSRKGLKGTLAKLDEELPRSTESVSNRLALAKAVHIEKLMKKNKEQTNPLGTMIEVVVNFLIRKQHSSAVLLDTSVNSTRQINRPDTTKHLMRQDSSASPPSKINEVGNDTEATKPVLVHKNHGLLSTNDFSHGNPVTKSLDLSLSPTQPTPKLSSTSSKDSSSVCDKVSTAQVQRVEPRHLPISGRSQAFSVNPTVHGHKQSKVKRGTKQNFKPRSLVEYEAEREPEHVSGGEGMKDVDGPKMSGGDSLLVTSSHMTMSSGESTKSTSTNMGTNLDVHDHLKLHHGQGQVKDLEQLYGGGGAKVQTNELLLCEDLEDVDISIGPPSMSANTTLSRPVFSSGEPISLQSAKALREVLFGSAKAPSFNAEWRRQNFCFCDLPNLEYGLIQHKGGPCGVLACVQAYLLKHLMFSDPQRVNTSSPTPTHKERDTALVAALTDILWQAGGRKRAIIALYSRNPGALPYSASYRPDKITERLVLHTFGSESSLRSFIQGNLNMLQDESSSGCVLFLSSAVLTRDIDRVKAEMDEPSNRLIGAHGYCSQELVNLLLTGTAASNVFDGTIELDSGGANKHTLKGIAQQSEVGFLSLFEHFGSCKVGSHLKQPHYPIWVVCSESHFSVLFSHQRRLLSDRQLERKFALYYYDELANQDEAITLTIDNSQKMVKRSSQSEDNSNLVSPLEHCIRTKWKNAVVDWNGTEPIL